MTKKHDEKDKKQKGTKSEEEGQTQDEFIEKELGKDPLAGMSGPLDTSVHPGESPEVSSPISVGQKITEATQKAAESEDSQNRGALPTVAGGPPLSAPPLVRPYSETSSSTAAMPIREAPVLDPKTGEFKPAPLREEIKQAYSKKDENEDEDDASKSKK